MAGFEVTLHGCFWVITEVIQRITAHLDAKQERLIEKDSQRLESERTD